ncbi:MAG: hypothetical protein ACP5R5_11895, partial [Armatimonadota bacterium]
ILHCRSTKSRHRSFCQGGGGLTLTAGLSDLSLKAVMEQPRAFESLIRSQLEYYRSWRSKGAEGYSFIPPRYLVAIKTASDVFDMTARIIEKDPLRVLRRKVKPTRAQVIACGLRNLLAIGIGSWSWKEPDGDSAPSDLV